jgi:two-component system LytT family sensor kinase
VHTPKYHWFIRYKLYHLPFWFIYHIMWWTLTIGSISAVFNGILNSPYAIKFLFYVIFQAIGVYFNLYFLIPRYLEKDRYVQYVTFVIFTIIAVAVLIVPGYYVSAWLSVKSFTELYGRDPADYSFFFKANTLPSSAASMTLGMSVKLTKNWIQMRRKERLLEKEKLETELKFLKSQFNPHFLFNTINSIFVLIHKNPQMASESLAKFSDLLRYQLYECNEQQILLQQELSYLENFIELEKLRQEQYIELTLHIEEPSANNFTIAPFLLMPFLENAFKHVSKRRDKTNSIRMELQFNKNELILDISNSIETASGHTPEPVHYGGLGLKNVKRRLELLYPGQHELTIQHDDDHYRVLLRLYLHEQTIKTHEAVAEELSI